MNHSTHILSSSVYVALALSSMLMSPGCDPGGTEYAASVSVEVRFPGDDAATHDAVARVLVDVTSAEDGPPFFMDLELTRLAPDVWRRDVPFLPRDQRLRFAARALDPGGEVALSGETLATLTMDHQDVPIPLAPLEHAPPFQVPRIVRIVYPAETFAGQEEQVVFTVEGTTGEAIAVQITPLATPTTPAAEFSPATGRVTLTSTVANFPTVYTPPPVTVDTDFDYQVTLTDPRAQRAGASTSRFTVHVQPLPAAPDIVVGTQPSVQFNPVILRLTANGSELPGTVKLVAGVSSDSDPDMLAFQWSYTPDPGTPGATFADGGQGNPGLLEGYSVDRQGIITLEVTDEHGGTTTLHYQLVRDQFADPIDPAPAQRVRATSTQL